MAISEEPTKFFTYEYEDGTGRHLLPAEEGGWSLEGIGHAAILTTNFLLEGRVRRRAPYSDGFEIFLGLPRQGSWMTDFLIQLQAPGTWAGVAAGLSVNIPTAYRFFNRVISRASGQSSGPDNTVAFEDEHSGTFDALVEAVEPSLVRAHKVIRERKTRIIIARGDLHVEFNRETRDYVETTLKDVRKSSVVGNVASYNVNARTGRLYFDELRRTIPFLIHKDAGTETELVLGTSLQNYSGSRLANSDVEVSYLAHRSVDGRVKRITIYNARYLLGRTRGFV